MSPYTRYDASYMAGILLAFLCAGVSAPYALDIPNHGPQAAAMWLCLCIIAIALIAGYFRHLRNNTPERLHLLRLDVYQEVMHLVETGYDMLAPCESDRATARVLISVDDERQAVVEKETWRGACHFYVISPTGRMTRRISGDAPTRADYRWRDAPLTAARLDYLIQALRSTYSPRRRIRSDA